MSLEPRDLELHERLGIPADLLALAGVRRVDDREARERLAIGRFRGDLSGVLYPRIFPSTGREVGYRVRRDHPEIEGGRPKNKYISSIDRAHLYFVPGSEPLLSDTSTSVIFVESEKAALAVAAAAARAETRGLTVALGGCWGWRGQIGVGVDEHGARVPEKGALPDLDLIAFGNKRTAIILFDANVATNPKVAAARRHFVTELASRGADVQCVDLPVEDGMNGPDDYLARHGDEAFWALLKSPPAPRHYPRTDAGNGELFAALYGDRVRFDHAAQLFRVWDEHHWAADRDGAVVRMAKDAIRHRLQAASLMTQDTERQAEVKFSLQSESRRSMDAMLAMTQAERPIAVTGENWDRHPMLLAVKNGVVDLETGELRDGRLQDDITRVSPVRFDRDARAPRWERFMREIFAGHVEVAGYMQRVMGYSLTGLTAEQIFWILFGTGANGKSTFVETVSHHVYGPDFSWTMPFPSTSWSDSMSEYQKASLAGKRFVTSSEVTKGGRLNEELIKGLTGSDTVNARHPYGRPFTFTPQAKFFLRVNDKPQIRDESHGMWRRIRMIPFQQTFDVDTTLADTLKAEAPGIFNWALRGCLEWQREGLCEPASVQAATAQYREEQDQLAAFLEACCLEMDGVSSKAGVLFEAYRQWAADNVRTEDRLNQKTFGQRLQKRFAFREGRHTVYFGVAIADSKEAREVA